MYYNITDKTATQSQGASGPIRQPGWHSPVALLPGWHKSPKAVSPIPAWVTQPCDVLTVMLSAARVASCWLLSCSWGETASWKKWHRCAVEVEASHHVWWNFWRNYVRQAFSTWSHQIYWCQQLSSTWDSWRGMSHAKESGLKAVVCTQLRNLCYGEEMGEFCSCMSAQGFCDIQRYFRDFKKLL